MKQISLREARFSDLEPFIRLVRDGKIVRFRLATALGEKFLGRILCIDFKDGELVLKANVSRFNRESRRPMCSHSNYSFSFKPVSFLKITRKGCCVRLFLKPPNKEHITILGRDT